MRKIVKLAAVGFLAAAAWTGQARAQEVTLKLHHFLPPPSTAHALFLKPWADKVMAESKGRIKIDLYPSMQLGGKPPQLYDQVRDGVADLVWTLPGYTAGRFPISEVFELPFIAGSAEATSQAVQEFSEKYLKDEFKDVKPLVFHVYQPGTIFTTKKQIRTVEDLKGLKIRTPTRIITELAKAMGATPVAMPVPELPEALSKGVVDGTTLPFEVAMPLKVHELARHQTGFGHDPGFFTAVFMFAMNKQKYDALPADLKKVIDDNSGLKLAAQVGKIWDKAENEGRSTSKAAGADVYIVPPADLAKWRDATKPVIDQWIAEMKGKGHDGQKFVDEAKALVAKYSKK